MQIIWLGHSGFRIEIEDAVLLIDPWLTGNPMFPAEARAAAIAGATHIVLTHGHGDHTGDALAIAKDLSIPVVGIYDMIGFFQSRDGVQGLGFNKGGTVTLGGARLTMVNACHSSSLHGDAASDAWPLAGLTLLPDSLLTSARVVDADAGAHRRPLGHGRVLLDERVALRHPGHARRQALPRGPPPPRREGA